MAFEFKIFDITHGSPKVLEAQLNEIGREGYHLVAVVGNNTLILEREIPRGPDVDVTHRDAPGV